MEFMKVFLLFLSTITFLILSITFLILSTITFYCTLIPDYLPTLYVTLFSL